MQGSEKLYGKKRERNTFVVSSNVIREVGVHQQVVNNRCIVDYD
jgi:hypothetical protein